MTKLTDTQAILLSTAAQRDSGSLLPLPASLKPGGGASKAMAALATRGLAEERETNDATAVRRTDGDIRFGLFLTEAGAAAIGVSRSNAGEEDRGDDKALAPASGKAPSKTAAVLDLLGRPTGASLAELIEATGWLPHTTRAALTGLRKKGHEVTRRKRDGVTCYSVAAK